MRLDSGLSCVSSCRALLIVPTTIGAAAAREPVISTLARVGPGLCPKCTSRAACANARDFLNRAFRTRAEAACDVTVARSSADAPAVSVSVAIIFGLWAGEAAAAAWCAGKVPPIPAGAWAIRSRVSDA